MPQSTRKIDYLLLTSASVGGCAYMMHWFGWLAAAESAWIDEFCASVFSLFNTMWWGIAFGIVAISLLAQLPRSLVMSALGTRAGTRGIFRAVLAGILLDLCSHGILMVGAKLYERGATIGQTIAFLVASPWNSFSLVLVLLALVGPIWTLTFILLSAVIAVTTGMAFDACVHRQLLPTNPNTKSMAIQTQLSVREEWRNFKRSLKISWPLLGNLIYNGIIESRMVVRWLFFGIIFASIIKASLSDGHMTTYFGPTGFGLAMTIMATTIIEVCSEGSSPIAADLLNRSNAPGNAFAFLMGGIATDYTEIMVLRETTQSIKLALVLPLLVLPQVIVIAVLLNSLHSP